MPLRMKLFDPLPAAPTPAPSIQVAKQEPPPPATPCRPQDAPGVAQAPTPTPTPQSAPQDRLTPAEAKAKHRYRMVPRELRPGRRLQVCPACCTPADVVLGGFKGAARPCGRCGAQVAQGSVVEGKA